MRQTILLRVDLDTWSTMVLNTQKDDPTQPEAQRVSVQEEYKTWLGKVHPYFKDPERIVVLKLDAFLLTWAFVAGLLKDMDQSATTQA